MSALTQSLAPALFIPHGGGPLPLLGEPSHAVLNAFLAGYMQTITRPVAIVVVSAHWEAPVATITSGETPALIYDYYGFPPESYRIQYPAAGSSALAERIAALLADHGVAAQLDARRGFDHGVFVPLKIMQPDASIPCVQISLLRSLDARAHIALGNALRKLREENVMILGSGFSTHNLQVMLGGINADTLARNDAFQSWLVQACTNETLTQSAREALLVDWARAPQARFCHPREEHLLPLMVCLGSATQAARCIFDDDTLGMRCLAFEWRD